MAVNQDFHLRCVTFKMPIRNQSGDGQRGLAIRAVTWFNLELSSGESSAAGGA